MENLTVKSASLMIYLCKGGESALPVASYSLREISCEKCRFYE